MAAGVFTDMMNKIVVCFEKLKISSYVTWIFVAFAQILYNSECTASISNQFHRTTTFSHLQPKFNIDRIGTSYVRKPASVLFLTFYFFGCEMLRTSYATFTLFYKGLK